MPRLLLCIFQFCLAAIFVIAADPTPAAAQDPKVDLSTLFEGIDLRPSESAFIAPPREVIRPLVRCKKLLAKNEIADAVEILGELMADDTSEDFLIPRGSSSFESLRRRTEEILGAIDEKYLEPYRVRYDIRARQLLEKGVAESNPALLKKVSSQFFFTDSGSEAAMLLGHMDLSSGQPSAAQSWFQKVVRFRSTARRHDPEASILLATCQLLGNDQGSAKATLLKLKQRLPQSSISFQGKKYPLFNRDQDALAWLTSLIGDSPLASNNAFSEWLMFQGNPARTGKVGTGMPLLAPRWDHVIGDSLALQEEAETYLEELVQDNLAPAPASQPLVVENTVVYRDMERLYGVDFETGRRKWSWPPQLAWKRKANEAVGYPEQAKLYQRLVLDSIFGQASSDGRHVFFIPNPGSPSQDDFSDNLDDPVDIRQHNELVAIDASQNGLLAWRVGGPTGLDEPKLAETFFMGEPLPLEGLLYCCCIRDNAVQLIALDSRNGQLRWAQSIASIDRSTFNANEYRRLAGVTPSYSNGKLVCLTGTGGVVAIEVSTRNLLWGFEFRLPQNARVISDSQGYANGLKDIWRDSVVTIANGKVFLTPVLSRHLICLGLDSGKEVWFEEGGFIPRRLARDSSLYLAGIDQNQLVLVGANDVRSVDANTGVETWRLTLPEGDLLSGRGYIGEGSLFVPAASRKILKIDLATGEIADSVATERILGNLSRVEGDVISYGLDHVASYPELAANKKAIKEIAVEQLDEKQKFVRAQLMIQEGDAEAGLDLLIKLATANREGPFASILKSLVTYFEQSDPVLSVKALDGLKRLYPEFDISELEQSRGLFKLRMGQYEESLQLSLDEIEKDFAEICESDEVELSGDIARRISASFLDLVDEAAAESESEAEIEPVANPIGNELLQYSKFGWQRTKLVLAIQGLRETKNEQAVSEATNRIAELIAKGMNQSAEQFEWLLARLHEQVMDAQTLESISQHYLKQKQHLAALMYANSAIRVASPDSANMELLKAEILFDGGDLVAASDVIEQIKASGLDEASRESFNELADQVSKALESGQDPLRVRLSDDDWLLSAAARVQSSKATKQEMPHYGYPARYDRASPQRIKDLRMMWRPGANEDKDFEVRDRRGKLSKSVQIRENVDSRDIGYTAQIGVDFESQVAEITIGKLHFLVDWFKVIAGESGNLWSIPDQQIRNSQTALIGGREFIYANRVWLICCETLTGKEIWKRRLSEPIKSVVANGEQIATWSETDRQVKVIDTTTGRLTGTYRSKQSLVKRTVGEKFVFHRAIRKGELPKDQEQALIGTGDIEYPALIGWQYSGFDPASGELSWDRVFYRDTKIRFIDQVLCALDTTGSFQCISVATGEVLSKVDLSLSPDQIQNVKEFNLQRHRNNWVLHVSFTDQLDSTRGFQRGTSTYYYESIDEMLSSGPVYLLDESRTKVVWESPIHLEQLEYAKEQPADSPAIIFARVVGWHPNEQGAKHHLQFVLLDERRGEVIGNVTVETLDSSYNYSIQWQPSAQFPSQTKLVVTTATETAEFLFANDDERPPTPRTHLTFNAIDFFEDPVFEKPAVKVVDVKIDDLQAKAKAAEQRRIESKDNAAAELKKRLRVTTP